MLITIPKKFFYPHNNNFNISLTNPCEAIFAAGSAHRVLQVHEVLKKGTCGTCGT